MRLSLYEIMGLWTIRICPNLKHKSEDIHGSHMRRYYLLGWRNKRPCNPLPACLTLNKFSSLNYTNSHLTKFWCQAFQAWFLSNHWCIPPIIHKDILVNRHSKYLNLHKLHKGSSKLQKRLPTRIHILIWVTHFSCSRGKAQTSEKLLYKLTIF